MKIITIISAIALLTACNTTAKKQQADSASTTTDTLQASAWQGYNDSVILRPLENKFVVGNFYGNGKRDTVFQRCYSNNSQAYIDSVPSPFECDWDEVVAWFYHHDIEMQLCSKTDTIHFGITRGFYCLINLGDLNRDGRDELALVPDHCDWSAVNNCRVYTICGSKWVLLNCFEVREWAFYTDADSDTIPSFTEIEGFLEKRKGSWFYKDYAEYFENMDTQPEDELKPLKVSTCREAIKAEAEAKKNKEAK